MGFMDKLKNLITDVLNQQNNTPQRSPERVYTEEKFYVAGMYYYDGNIQKLGCYNKNYRKSGKTLVAEGLANKKIFKYSYINKPVKLVIQSDNPEDYKAIAVYIAGELVGYINTIHTSQVMHILKNREIKFISSFIGGGKFKIASENCEVVEWDNGIHITIKIGYI